jgi:hypothetical protein
MDGEPVLTDLEAIEDFQRELAARRTKRGAANESERWASVPP